MNVLQGPGHKLAVSLVCACLAVLVLSVDGPSLAGAGSAASPGTIALLAHEGARGNPPIATPHDPPSGVPTVIASVKVGTEPVAGAVDLATGLVYVANSISNNVSVLNGTSVVATIDLAPNQTGTPVYVTYDAVNGYVYVVDRYDFESTGGAVNVVNGTSVVATVPVGHMPDMAVVDPLSGDVYVTNSGGSAVTILAGTTLLASVPVGLGPSAAAYDPIDGYVYVANEGSANVSALFGTAVVDTLGAGSGPDSVAYDPADGFVYVASNVSGNVSIYDDLTVAGNVAVGADPSFLGFNPSLGGVEVANTNSSTVTILNGTAAVGTLAVAAGPVWLGVDPSGTFTFVVGSLSDEVTVLYGPVTLRNVTVGSVPTYGVADPSNQLTYVLNSGSNNVSVFALGYPVVFDETGLAPGVGWSVALGSLTNSSTTPSIGFLEASGTYAYSIAVPSGYTLVSSVPASPVSVTESTVTVNVTFAPIPRSAYYTLTFNETGLPTCHAHDGGKTSKGSGECCHASSLSWSVTVNGVTKATNNTSLSFSEPNGTYNYTVDAPSGYTVSSSIPASPVTIAGANVTVAVTFERACHTRSLSITFEEWGLPKNTVWCVTLNVTQCSSGRDIVFSGLSPGSYGFNVSAVTGYTARPDAGTVRLSDQSQTVTVKFSEHHHGGCGG